MSKTKCPGYVNIFVENKMAQKNKYLLLKRLRMKGSLVSYNHERIKRKLIKYI